MSLYIEKAKAYRILLWIAFMVIALDQSTKIWIHHLSGLEHGYYPPYGGIVIIPDVFAIVFATNYGAAWGMLANQGFLLTCLAFLVLALILIFRDSLELKRTSYQIVFGLISGGIIGNLIDRIAYGYVVDFLDLNLGFYRWPTFNIADSAIVCGVILYSFYSFKSPPSSSPQR